MVKRRSEKQLQEIFEQESNNKLSCFERELRFLPSVLMDAKMQVDSDKTSTSNDSTGSSSELDFYSTIDTALEKFHESILKEERLLLEEAHSLSMSLKCQTGVSVARGLAPVIRLDSSNVFSDPYGRAISFMQYDWERFVSHLACEVKRYFQPSDDNQSAAAEPLLISFNDYTIKSTLFLNEKAIKLQWDSKASIYLSKEVVLKILDFKTVLERRMKMLSEMSLAVGYYRTLDMLNDVLDPVEKKRIEEVPTDLIMKIANCLEKTLGILFCEMLIYNPETLLRDLNRARHIYF